VCSSNLLTLLREKEERPLHAKEKARTRVSGTCVDKGTCVDEW
jgi:hypothetical protein